MASIRITGGWPRVAAVSLSIVLAAAFLIDRRALPPLGASSQPAAPSPQPDEQQARTTCGGCHTFPPPDILPKQAWPAEFVRMLFIRDNRTPPNGSAPVLIRLPPDMQQALQYFSKRAPEHLRPPDAWPDVRESPVRFARGSRAINGSAGPPTVSNLQLVDLDGDGQLDVLGADMRQGAIFAGPASDGGRVSVIARVPHPSHVTMTDVDRDGVQDLLVGDLGEFYPGDHDKGAVVWLRGLRHGRFGAFRLGGWPRVADVEAADFNGDGLTDFGVAAFGWRKAGQVAILENRTVDRARPVFTRHTIDPRPGSINVIPADLNGDGRIDLVTVLAQEHETVLAYINNGTGDASFERQVIYAAPHPNWGSSGIQVVDLDRDGDLDVLLTHGDTFDDGLVKPYHGVQWLENRGTYPFVEHPLAQIPGVHRAVAADIDGDGDLDVVACALLAAGSDLDEKTLPALVWLEQTTAGTFTRHSIEIGLPRHATLAVADIDADGDLDIVTGTFIMDASSSVRSTAASIDIWTNQLKAAR